MYVFSLSKNVSKSFHNPSSAFIRDDETEMSSKQVQGLVA